jgi:hypothetical protein
VPVQTLIDFLETGETIDDFLAVYPAIPRRHVFSFLELSREYRNRSAGMRVVIDASIDPRLVEAFPDHHVRTLFDLGWQHLKDHVLVKQLACDVLITADRGFEYEHDLKSLSFGIVIVHVARNKIAFYRPLFPQLL